MQPKCVKNNDNGAYNSTGQSDGRSMRYLLAKRPFTWLELCLGYGLAPVCTHLQHGHCIIFDLDVVFVIGL